MFSVLQQNNAWIRVSFNWNGTIAFYAFTLLCPHSITSTISLKNSFGMFVKLGGNVFCYAVFCTSIYNQYQQRCTFPLDCWWSNYEIKINGSVREFYKEKLETSFLLEQQQKIRSTFQMHGTNKSCIGFCFLFLQASASKMFFMCSLSLELYTITDWCVSPIFNAIIRKLRGFVLLEEPQRKQSHVF